MRRKYIYIYIWTKCDSITRSEWRKHCAPESWSICTLCTPLFMHSAYCIDALVHTWIAICSPSYFTTLLSVIAHYAHGLHTFSNFMRTCPHAFVNASFVLDSRSHFLPVKCIHPRKASSYLWRILFLRRWIPAAAINHHKTNPGWAHPKQLSIKGHLCLPIPHICGSVQHLSHASETHW